MPTFRSMCHGGIWWTLTRSLIALTHGRTTSYVVSDIGAIDPTRWQSWHFAWKIGATSLAKVGLPPAARASARAEGSARPATIATTPETATTALLRDGSTLIGCISTS